MFSLTADTIERLTAKFRAFQDDREKLRVLLSDYVTDYRRFEGNELARQEHLREKYARRAPQFSHLVWDEQNGLFWGVTDVSILLCRDRSSVSRTLVKMMETEGWSARLLALRRVVSRSETAPVYAYGEGIFDLIIDYYEEDYLLRFTKPRRGNPLCAEEAEEVRRFWNYLKMKATGTPQYSLQEGEPAGLQDIPPMSLKEALRLIFSRMFTLRAGALFSVLFALCYELSRRWPALHLWFPAAAVLLFLLCIPLLLRGKFEPASVAGLGAGALIFCLFWLVGSISHEGLIRIPGGNVVQARDIRREANLVLNPYVGNNGTIALEIATDARDIIKQFYYRVSPDTEYRSTGSTLQTNPVTGLKYPEPSIITGQTHGLIQLDIKYTDALDAEHGPYSFQFDLDKVRLEAGKDYFLKYADPWITVKRRMSGTNEKFAVMITFVKTDPSLFSDRAMETISAILCGVNSKTPVTEVPIKAVRNVGYLGSSLIETEEDTVDFISAQLLFRDGTSSDVRIFSKTEGP